MKARKPSSSRALLLLLMLVVGPLQVQSAFACTMMDEVMHGECCCTSRNNQDDLVDADREVAVDSNTEPCCEQITRISVDEEARQNAPLLKPVEVRSDVDPPHVVIVCPEEFMPLQLPAAMHVYHAFQPVCHSGRETYLVTQRLRI